MQCRPVRACGIIGAVAAPESMARASMKLQAGEGLRRGDEPAAWAEGADASMKCRLVRACGVEVQDDYHVPDEPR